MRAPRGDGTGPRTLGATYLHADAAQSGLDARAFGPDIRLDFGRAVPVFSREPA
ncbi:hypothetical protein [Paramicrobacterium agarici]|uniref:hypothetical protein n=1 Tax=Paramicrobacterium agarici TaxID=630514 RepID=UPI001476ED47|nr:hypothetical protein [Microbacterium agarici]